MLPTNYTKHTSKNLIQKVLIRNFNNNLIKVVTSLNPLKILDVGCGEGFTMALLNDNHLGNKLIGVDYEDSALNIGRNLFPNLMFTKASIYDLPFSKGSFDLVICSEVLEHLKNPLSALKELIRVSSKYVLITVPNEPLFQLTNFVRGKYIKSWGNHPEHINHWNEKSLIRVINNYGKVITVFKPYPWIGILINIKKYNDK